MILADYTPRKRREVIALTLAPILNGLVERVPTSVVVEAVAAALATDERHLISKVLLSELAAGCGAARQDGEPFVKFGRTMRRWTWGPVGPRAAPAAAVVDRMELFAALANDKAALKFAYDHPTWGEDKCRMEAAEYRRLAGLSLDDLLGDGNEDEA